MAYGTVQAVNANYEVVVDGEVDVDTSGALRSRLGQAMGAPATAVVLDTSGVTFMDCSGVRELVAARAKLAASGRALHLKDPSAAVTTILELTGLSTVFGLRDDQPVVTGSARGLGIGGVRLHLVPPLTPVSSSRA